MDLGDSQHLAKGLSDQVYRPQADIVGVAGWLIDGDHRRQCSFLAAKLMGLNTGIGYVLVQGLKPIAEAGIGSQPFKAKAPLGVGGGLFGLDWRIVLEQVQRNRDAGPHLRRAGGSVYDLTFQDAVALGVGRYSQHQGHRHTQQNHGQLFVGVPHQATSSAMAVWWPHLAQN